LRAIRLPMLPTPMNPTRAMLFSELWGQTLMHRSVPRSPTEP
jgi:hypothetical protein